MNSAKSRTNVGARFPIIFPNVELGAYVIMPNHAHGIIVIRNIDTPSNVGATHASPLRIPNSHPHGAPPRSLGAIVGSFKSAVTKRIGRELNATGIWQRNYYEHIIRDEKDLQNKTDYIEANPMLWDEDDNNPRNYPSSYVGALHATPLHTIINKQLQVKYLPMTSTQYSSHHPIPLREAHPKGCPQIRRFNRRIRIPDYHRRICPYEMLREGRPGGASRSGFMPASAGSARQLAEHRKAYTHAT